MNSYTETGFLRISLDVSKMGPMNKSEAEIIESEITNFFKDKELSIEGKVQFISINTLELKHNNSKLDTTA